MRSFAKTAKNQPDSKSARLRGKSAEESNLAAAMDDDEGGDSSERRSDLADVAAAQCETMRMVREMIAIVYLTFIFPNGDIAEGLTAAGQAYASENKGKKAKNAFPPCVGKWCSLIVGIVDALESALKGGVTPKDSKPIATAMKNDMDKHLAVLTSHAEGIGTKSDLIAYQLHCSHRMNHDGSLCILTISAPHYAEVVKAIQAAMKFLFDVSPEAGPPPPTKAERRAMAVARKHKGKK